MYPFFRILIFDRRTNLIKRGGFVTGNSLRNVEVPLTKEPVSVSRRILCYGTLVDSNIWGTNFSVPIPCLRLKYNKDGQTTSTIRK